MFCFFFVLQLVILFKSIDLVDILNQNYLLELIIGFELIY